MPQYVADAGVKSLKDLGAHKDQFGGKIYGIEAGNDGNRIISGMIAKPENNLAGFELVESSEAGMLTQAEKAMKNNDWIVFLGWTPHPVMGEMKIAYLDGMGNSDSAPRRSTPTYGPACSSSAQTSANSSRTSSSTSPWKVR